MVTDPGNLPRTSSSVEHCKEGESVGGLGINPESSSIDASIEFSKVLVVSATPFSKTRNNGKTLASFFEGWPKDRIAQLYFYPELPTSTICDTYFNITDGEMLRSLCSMGGRPGSSVSVSPLEMSPTAPRKGFYSNWLIDSEIARCLRELVWLLGKWKTEALDQWFDAFAPEMIFFNGSGNIFHYRIIKYLAGKSNTAITIILGDDYFLPRRSLSPAYWFRLFWLRITFTEFCRLPSVKVMTLCDEMSQVYARSFGINSSVMPYSIELPEAMPSPPPEDPTGLVRLIYLGGLHLNRWRTLSAIGKALKTCGSLGLKARLEIYCQERPSPEVLKQLEIPEYSQYHGPLNSAQVLQMLKEGQILVHVESFDYISRKMTRLSMSTKIPEYLASARAILAVGPPEVSSIRYLQQTGCAKVVTQLDEASLVAAVTDLISNKPLQERLRAESWATACRFHDLPKTKTRFRAALRARPT